MNVVIIPARGGSKRIPHKNIKNFNGKPIIYWPLKVLQNSNLFDKIIVSTDDPNISKLALSLGAEVPFLRPKNISDDYSNVSDVMSHAVNWLKKSKVNMDVVCCVYSTAAFITENDLQNGFQLFRNNDFNFVFSATTFPYPIQRAFKRIYKNGVKMIDNKYIKTRSQDLEETYHDAAQFYFGKPDSWINNNEIFSHSSEIVVLPKWRVQDIDTQEDWKRAEILHKTLEYSL